MTIRSHTVFVALLTLLSGITIDSKLQAAAPSEAEWAKTVAAAKKEGKISVFLYQRENIEAAVRAFEKNYPDIQVVTAATPAAETGPRLMAERRAGKFLWDVCICGPTTPFSVLYPAKALDPIKPALMLAEVVDADKWWEGKHHYMDPEGNYIFVFLGSVDMPNLFYPPSQKATGVNPWMNARWVPSVALAKEGTLRRVPPYEVSGGVPRLPGLRSRSYFGGVG